MCDVSQNIVASFLTRTTADTPVSGHVDSLRGRWCSHDWSPATRHCGEVVLLNASPVHCMAKAAAVLSPGWS